MSSKQLLSFYRRARSSPQAAYTLSDARHRISKPIVEVSPVTTATLKTGLTMLIAAAIGTTLAGNALAEDKPADWPSYNRTLSGDRYAPQAAVTPATAKQLQQVCSHDLGRQSSFQTGPVVIDDTIFRHSAESLKALNCSGFRNITEQREQA
jgi:glucose dehydrogenase